MVKNVKLIVLIRKKTYGLFNLFWHRKPNRSKDGLKYAILTAEISRASFGITPSEYKRHKNIKQKNLRNHMTDLELIFIMLGGGKFKFELKR
jgi:hypothetical protein